MKKEKSTNTAIRITPTEKASLESAAKEMGMTFTDLLKIGASFYTDFDPTFRKRIANFSRALKMPEYVILQNLALEWFAHFDGKAEVYPTTRSRLLDEFAYTAEGPVTGEPFYAARKEHWAQYYRDIKESNLTRLAALRATEKES